jgi:cytochrome c peroxidase
MRFWILLLAALSLAPAARAADDPPRPPSLKTVPVPEPANLDEFVRDREAAIALGKALFWDMQVGSDGVMACATCHFRAGADARSQNQVSPGLRRVGADGAPDPDRTFAPMSAPNRRLSAADFPLWPRSNDVVGSAGMTLSAFDGWVRGGSERLRTVVDPDGFAVEGVNVRRVTSRNAPTMINAVFNHRQFWDGRAQNVFNGVNGLGDLDPDARVWRADDPRSPVPVRVRLEDSSLASQAVGPVTSTTELSAEGRTFRHVATKLARGPREIGGRIRTLRPLAGQLVDRDDGVLGPLSRWPRPGLRVVRYEDLVKRAFHRVWWKATRRLREAPDGSMTVVRTSDGDPTTDEMTLLQANFPLFFGLAIQLYESTLVADDSPYDRFMDGDTQAVDDAALRGADVFRSQTRGRCINCHEGAELTGASVRRVRESPTRIREGQALDRGFNNIGVLPTLEDLGVGGRDPLGNPLSTVRRLPTAPPEPIAVDGAVKVPGLRNVELTAPYFHTGGVLTLRDVLLFYSRGGDVRPQWSADGGLEIAPVNVLDNDDAELAALEAFLRALTDERVRFRRAPFDHPQLFVADGHLGDETAVVDDGSGRAVDRLVEIPEVGRDGGLPLPGFLEE